MKPKVTGPLKLQVANKPTGATGSLRVLVSRSTTNVTSGLPVVPTLAAAPTVTAAQDGTGLVSETVAVPAASGTVLTAGALEQGAEYRLTVDGSADLGEGVATDGRCLSVGGTWWSQASLERTVPDQAHGRLYVDGVAFDGDATNGGSALREPVAHVDVHRHPLRAPRARALGPAGPQRRRRAGDRHRAAPHLDRHPEAAPAETPAATTPWTQRSETVTRQHRHADRHRVGDEGQGRPEGHDDRARDLQVRQHRRRRVLRGHRLRLGHLRPVRAAPARSRSSCGSTASASSWRPATGTTACAGDHAYTATFTATKNGPLRLRGARPRPPRQHRHPDRRAHPLDLLTPPTRVKFPADPGQIPRRPGSNSPPSRVDSFPSSRGRFPSAGESAGSGQP